MMIRYGTITPIGYIGRDGARYDAAVTLELPGGAPVVSTASGMVPLEQFASYAIMPESVPEFLYLVWAEQIGVPLKQESSDMAVVKRIGVAVNACAGIPTEALQAGTLRTLLELVARCAYLLEQGVPLEGRTLLPDGDDDYTDENECRTQPLAARLAVGLRALGIDPDGYGY